MRWPLLEALRSFRSEHGGAPRGRARVDAPTLVLTSAIVLGWLVSLAIPFRMDWWMARTHLDVPWPLWAVTQPIPFMYTMENRWEALPETPPDPAVAPECEGNRTRFHPHQLPASLFSPSLRARWYLCGQPTRAHLVSVWRDHRYETTWRYTPDEQGVLVVEREP